MSGQQSDALRVRLLAAAVAELQTLELPAMLRGIGVRTIAKRAGSSPTSFFREFGDVESFAAALLDWLYDPTRFKQATFEESISHVAPSPLPMATNALFHIGEFRRLRDDDEQLLRSTLWAYAGEEGRSRYESFLQMVDEAFVPRLEAMLASWGRETRPPITSRDLVVLNTALVMGYVLRDRVDPGATDVEKYWRAASAHNLLLLRVVGDPQDLDDRLTETNYYPTEGRALARRTSDRTGTRQVILQVAAELFGGHGYDKVTMAQVARSAGVAESTLYALFPGKQQLAAAIFRDQALLALGDLPPATDLVEHLARLCAFARPRRAAAAPYLAEVAVPQPRTDDDVLVRQTAQHLGIPPGDPLAETVVALVVRLVLADPSEDPLVVARQAAPAVMALAGGVQESPVHR